MLGVPCIERDAANAVRLYMLVAGCVREQRAGAASGERLGAVTRCSPQRERKWRPAMHAACERRPMVTMASGAALLFHHGHSMAAAPLPLTAFEPASLG